MQPSQDGRREPSDALRRFGPLIALVVLVLGAAGLIVLSGGGGSDDPADAAQAVSDVSSTGVDEGDAPGGAGEPATDRTALPTGAIPFSLAEAAGLDIEWDESCDTEAGRVRMPTPAAPECYAPIDPDADYEPPPGVTEDTITVVAYIYPDSDPILRAAMGPVNADDTSEQMAATYQQYVDIYNALAQTYGRTVELEILRGSGVASDEVAARADAVRAVEELDAFAVMGFPLLAEAAWSEEIQARGRICICGGALGESMAPQTFTAGPSGAQIRAHLAEYVAKKLDGHRAVHAGDSSMHGQQRVFGRIYLDNPGAGSDQDARRLESALADLGVAITEHIGYELDLSRLQEQIAMMITRLKDSGVTTVILSSDPISTKAITEEATQQDYFPEWVLGDGVLLDTTAFGRTFDQRQWENAFGISALSVRLHPDLADHYNLFRWFHGAEPPAPKATTIIGPNPALLFAGIQAAGPNLTNDTFREGLFTMPVPDGRRVTGSHVSFGERGLWDDAADVVLPDHFGVDDFTEIWWDPTGEGTDEVYNVGTGMFRYVDGGRRYRYGEWTDELGAFDLEGTVTEYSHRPAGEDAPDYPRPRR